MGATWLLRTLAAASLAVSGSAGCSSDFEDLPMGLDRADHGWLVSIEPDEPLEVGLIGSALYPDAQWRVTDLDESVVVLEQQDYDKLGQDLKDFTGDARATVTISFLRAVELGESPLTFELLGASGERVGIAEFVVRIVENSCDVDAGLVANRCGRTVVEQPQALTEIEHGWLVALEPGEQIDVVLTGNALYPDGAWQLDEADNSAISVADPINRPADRTPGDWDSTSDASFLPTWTFAVTATDQGRARAEFSFHAENRLIDVYSVTFDVVQDACATDSNQSTCNQ
jgi:hypothetical protein